MQRERFITMASNSDVEVNLGPAPLHSNSRFVIEDLVPANLDNAPHAQQENKSPRYVRNGPRPEVSERGAPRQRQEPALRSHRRVIRLLGGNSTRKESNITDRRRAPDTETFPSFLRRDTLPSGPPAMDPLEQLKYNTEVAELQAKLAAATARETAALEAAAISRRNIQQLAVETQQLARRATPSSGSSSESGLNSATDTGSDESEGCTSHTSARKHHGSRSARAADRQQAAQRREDQELEERRQDREDRREARKEAREARRAEERREEREERRAFSAQLAATAALYPAGHSQYRIGAAIKDFRLFDGKEDGATYLLELTHQLGTHQITPEHWPRELSLKLTGKAATWYASRFPGLRAGTFPPWGEFYSAILLAYSQLYGAAEAFQNLHGATRTHGSTGKEVLHRIAELEMLLRRKGVDKPGHEEMMAYILQNQLSSEEFPRWTSLANADPAVSDAALNDLELNTADAPAGRNSCPPRTREAFFATRCEHLRNFLREQGRATTTGRPLDNPAVKAAVANDTPANPGPATQAASPSGTLQPVAERMVGSREAARSSPEYAAQVRAAQAKWTARSTNTKPPPLYHGSNSVHRTKNAATFAARTAARECYGCNVYGELVAGQPHWECALHGIGAPAATKSLRVSGSGGSSTGPRC